MQDLSAASRIKYSVTEYLKKSFNKEDNKKSDFLKWRCPFSLKVWVWEKLSGWGCHHVEISADILCRWFVSLCSGHANPAPSSDLDTKLRAQPI